LFIGGKQPAEITRLVQKKDGKVQMKIDECTKLGLTFYKQEFIESYIKDNIYLLKNSIVIFLPTCCSPSKYGAFWRKYNLFVALNQHASERSSKIER
jgi:hypothetical protein